MENLIKAFEPYWEDEYPYEVHVTVKEAPSYEHFKNVCQSVGVKPIVLDLHTKSSTIINDVMTSESFKASGKGLVNRVIETVEALKNAGYEVIRHKIETVPWHPNARTTVRARTPSKSDNYFEVHIPFPVAPDELEGLRNAISYAKGVHISRNATKTSVNGKMVHMITMRNYECTYDTFRFYLSALKWNLALYAQSLGDEETIKNLSDKKDEVEWAIFDSNVYRDNEWMKNG